jgi:cyclophilin family peptidyl-prolyl cis-trans isomerase
MSLKFIGSEHTHVDWWNVHERFHAMHAGSQLVSRLLPLVALVALVVAGGLWLARDGASFPPTAAAEAATPEEPADEAEAAGDAEATEDAEAGDAGAEGATAAATIPDEVPVPEGYEMLPPFSDERRTSFDRAEPQLEAGVDYAALIETNRGAILVDLYQDETPITVNSFVFLTRHRYYDGIVFHRVLEDFMAQTGDPTGTGTGGPGYQFDDEIVPGLSHDEPGVLSMANAGRGTNGSQFFITFTATPWLDGAHTVFGRVLDGIEVLDDLQRVDPQTPTPTAAARFEEDVAVLREAGIDVQGEGTVGEVLARELGAAPVPGQAFEIGGYRGVIGTLAGEPAVGFFPFPDRMERVTILTRPSEAVGE